MATYTKETALYDTGKIGTDIDAAGETASKYITAVDQNGIKVHAENSDNINYSLINAEGMEVFKGTTVSDSKSVAKFGDTTRIGTENDASITITDTSLTGTGEGGKEFFRFANSDTQITTQMTSVAYRGAGQAFPISASTGISRVLSETPATGSNIQVKFELFNRGVGYNYANMQFTQGTENSQFKQISHNGTTYTVYARYNGNSTIDRIYSSPQMTSVDSVSCTITYSSLALAPSFEIGEGADASGAYSYAEGYHVTASGNYSHAEGYYATASGNYSHAQGSHTQAAGSYAHAEGFNATASSNYSHAEGGDTQAVGSYSHAEGNHTQAVGNYSHTQNNGTIANYACQTIIGKFNKNKQNSAFEIGNGSSELSSKRSNAFEVDWDGNVNIAGSYNINGTGLIDIFYPVGSYYETSDANFNPNTAWGGTWSLEAGGLVHIGADSNYTIGDTGGNKDAIIPYHNHSLTNPTVTVPKHTHGFTQPKVTGGAVNDGITGGSHDHKIRTHSNSGSGSAYPFAVTSAASKYVDNGDRITSTTHTHNLPSHTHSVSGGAVEEKAAFDATVSGGSVGYAGTSGNLTDANMQPYIVVNRWHRTA